MHKHNNNLIVEKTPITTYLGSEGVRVSLLRTLGSEEKVAKFTTDLVTIYQSANLQGCDNISIINCVLQINALSLSMDRALGQVYLIPYNENLGEKFNYQEKKICTVQIGINGYKALAHRMGTIDKIFAVDIRDGEIEKLSRIRQEYVFNELPYHKRDKADVVGYYACIQKINGAREEDYMSVDEVKDHAKTYSSSYRSYLALKSKGKKTEFNIWERNFAEMAKKTVLKRLIKKSGFFTVYTDDIARAVTIDQATFGSSSIGQEEPLYIDNPSFENTSEVPRIEEKEEKGLL